MRWHAQEEHLEEEDRLGVHELAEAIGRAAVAPLRELGIDPGELERFELDYFLPLMFGPLAQAARRFGVQSD